MKIETTHLEGVLVIEPAVFGDHRGFFMESYNKKRFSEAGLVFDFVQDNHSLSQEVGTLRGLHYQLEPYAQTKLVRVVAGAVYDVAVDLRRGSPTFGQWYGVVLSAANKKQLLVPKGFAHGFCTLEPNSEVIYKVDALYSPEHDRGIRWDDPELAISWPTDKPTLSQKDEQQPFLRQVDFSVKAEAKGESL